MFYREFVCFQLIWYRVLKELAPIDMWDKSVVVRTIRLKFLVNIFRKCNSPRWFFVSPLPSAEYTLEVCLLSEDTEYKGATAYRMNGSLFRPL